MTQDEIVKMARETGLVRTGDKWVEPARWGVTELVHFAALVAAAERERIIMLNAPQIANINAHIKTMEDAVAAEREACARVCENLKPFGPELELQKATAEDCAAAIRARGDNNAP
jgi:hypothetical protein